MSRRSKGFKPQDGTLELMEEVVNAADYLRGVDGLRLELLEDVEEHLVQGRLFGEPRFDLL